jgi:hypothetical protein
MSYLKRGKKVLRDLGDGLILRRTTQADVERVVELNAQVHRAPGSEEPDEPVLEWTRDLMEREHPTFDVGDFTVVEDTKTDTLVSTLCLISQTWSYDGIPFGVGRPELVGTLPEYRKRGLVRAQFEVIHEWSAGRGEWVQGITGIPWFYRQFGYEMAMALGGGRIGYAPHIPEWKKDEEEPYRVRPATEADVPFIARVDEETRKRWLVSAVRDEALWRYEISGSSAKNVNRREMRVVESAAGEPVGFLAHPWMLWGKRMAITYYELKPGTSWLAVTPSVIRYLAQTGRAYAEAEGKEFQAFAFHLGPEHPAYTVVRDRLPRVQEPYAWYVRVADLPGFLRHVTPVLERRLAASPVVGYSGELKISFYRSGIQLTFDEGKLTDIESWEPSVDEGGNAAFPDLTFLQILFGYRSLEELDAMFPDCWPGRDEARALLNALFPKQVSLIWPVA